MRLLLLALLAGVLIGCKNEDDVPNAKPIDASKVASQPGSGAHPVRRDTTP